MTKKVLISFATFAVAVATAATYNVRLLEPSLVNGTELKAGTYKLDVLETENKAVFRSGKTTTEAKVKVENAGDKFHQTTFRYDRDPNGKMKLQEVSISGSSRKLF